MRNVRISSYRNFLIASGHTIVDKIEDADGILIWTCAFRKDTRDHSISEIVKCSKNKKEVFVAGCLPDIDKKYLARHFNGKVIPWRNDNILIRRYFGAGKIVVDDMPLVLAKEQLYEDEVKFRREHPGYAVPYIGRYIQLYIAEGCPWECSYCSERLAFPPFKSYPEDQILEAARREVNHSGKKKIILLADSVGDYGRDTGSSLPKLIRRIRKEIPGAIIAMQDLNPIYFLNFRDDMVEFIKEGFIAHFQIPYQSANDRMLKMMNRPYTKNDLVRVFGTLNEVKFKEIDSHIIVGFLNETEDEFKESVQFAIDYKIKYMLVNSFLESPNMEIAKFRNKVSWREKEKRIKYARQKFQEAGIICNYDHSSFAEERFKIMVGRKTN